MYLDGPIRVRPGRRPGRPADVSHLGCPGASRPSGPGV